MSTLLNKPTGTSGKVHDITPEVAGWRYVGFSLYRLKAGDTAAEATGDCEVILVMVEGKAAAGDYGEWRWRLVTNDLRHFDTAGAALKIFFTAAEGELRAVELVSTDDFYMHAVGDAVLDEPSPTDAWQDVRKPRNKRSFYQYNTNAPMRIVR